MPCMHQKPCPSVDAVDREAALTVATFPEQGWSLLCNGLVLFDDTGELLPDGRTVEPHRGPAVHAVAVETVTSRVSFGPGDPALAGGIPLQAVPQHAMSS